MATSSTRQLLGICFFLCYMLSLSDGRVTPNFKIRAVNLGGWLVTEGWIKPSLFDGIPNKDFLDGTGLQFKSVTVGKFLCAEQGGGTIIVANRTSASGWETFKLWRINETTFQFRVFNKQFMGLNYATGNGIDVVAIANTSSETFQIVRNSDDLSRVRIKAPNGFFLQVKTEELVTADSKGDGGWGDSDPSVFIMTISGRLQGEFQVTNGYGPLKAPQVMREHWSTFIVEEDFKFISNNGINAVRIPVGWWIASDSKPPHPYVGGSLQALDNAFLWSRKYDIKVIIDLHAAPGSQNGFEHSSPRDGFQEWGLSDQNIQQTVDVIDFLTARYANNPSLYAVELINEPLAPGASLDSIIKYYKAGYETVRKHSKTAYVVMSNRLGQVDPKELFPLASGLERTVIDVHYYNLFSDVFNDMTVQQNINFINTNRTADLNLVTTSNGPLTFVGEWVAEWQVSGATKEDYQKFAEVQLQVYGRATFGWAYWTLKNVQNHWSLQWMIQNGYIKL
uniref:Beta-glucosidase 1 GH5 family n=1 Tax=Camellia sinensis TaxID=4442 RepID=A0A1Y0K2D4_CAMSI|nr:beta-glucosidase 1 GH5 family [Camellia sinensis]